MKRLLLFSLSVCVSAGAWAIDLDVVAWPLDCNDGNELIFDGAAEVCDGFDNDCDDIVDEGCSRTCPATRPEAERVIRAGSVVPSNVQIVHTTTGYDLVWVDSRDGNPEIYLQEVDFAGNPLADLSRVSIHPSSSGDPAVSSTGESRLILWVDERSGRPQVHFTRCCVAFLALEVQLTSDATQDGLDPAAAFGGNDWAVVYAQGVAGDHEVYLQRVADTGVADPGRTQVSLGSGSARHPAIVFNGASYGVVWQDDRSGRNEIYFRAFDSALAPLGDEVPLTDAPGESTRPQIVWLDDRYVVVWEDDRDGTPGVYALVVDAAGSDLGSGAFAVGTATTDDRGPAVAATGGEALVSWISEPAAGGVEELLLARISPDATVVEAGRVQSSAGSALSDAGVAWSGSSPALAFVDPAASEVRFVDGLCCGDLDGDGFDRCETDCDDGRASVFPGALETCDGFDENCDQQIDDGCVADCVDIDSVLPAKLHISPGLTDASDVDLAWNGSTFGSVREDITPAGRQTVFQLLDVEGSAVGQPVVWPAAGSIPIPRIEAHPDGFTVAIRENGTDLRLRFLDLQGAETRPSVVVDLSDNGTNLSVSAFEFAWSGNGYGLSYLANPGGPAGVQAFFRLLSAEGTPFPATAFDVDASAADVAWSGSEYAMIYRGSIANEVVVQRFSAQGEPVGAAYVIGQFGSTPVRIDWDGRGYVITYDVRIEHLDPQLNRIWRTEMGIEARSGAAFGYNGDRYLLVWTTTDGVEAFLLNSDGNYLPGIGGRFLAGDSGGSTRFARIDVRWTGSRWLVGWHHAGVGMHVQEIGCCGEIDSDFDGSCLNDCAPDDISRYPGAPEVCNDGEDGNCDGLVADELPVEGLTFADKTMLVWNAVAGERFDLQRGDLSTLRSSGGDFALATTDCLLDDGLQPEASDGAAPAVGGGFIYFVAAATDACPGTYDSGGPAQQMSRDAGVAGSAGACP
ncbi:hypothetical protein ABI59_11550 [Acidobacteria bacterium Mor1]|nr:hypothetical protein ABI59_11550 [Acidobacteria bacterium Mor1]